MVASLCRDTASSQSDHPYRRFTDSGVYTLREPTENPEDGVFVPVLVS